MVRWCDRGRDTAAGSRCMNSSADSQRGMFGTMAFVVNGSAIALLAELPTDGFHALLTLILSLCAVSSGTEQRHRPAGCLPCVPVVGVHAGRGAKRQCLRGHLIAGCEAEVGGQKAAIHERQLMAVTMFSRALPQADFGRRDHRTKSQLPGAASNSTFRPSAVLGQRHPSACFSDCKRPADFRARFQRNCVGSEEGCRSPKRAHFF